MPCLRNISISACGAFVLLLCGCNQTKVISPSPVSPALPAPSPIGGVRYSIPSNELIIFNELNAVRSKGYYCGNRYMPPVGALVWSQALATAASGHAADMAASGYIGHVSPKGTTMQSRAEAAGYMGWKKLGENIAAGYVLSSVTQGWLGSPGHCENLMDKDFTEVGISYLYKKGSQYGTYWVQDFGVLK